MDKKKINDMEELIAQQSDIIEIQNSLIKNLKESLDKTKSQLLYSEGNEKMCRWAAEEARDMIKQYDKILLSLGKKEDRAQSQKWLLVFSD